MIDLIEVNSKLQPQFPKLEFVRLSHSHNRRWHTVNADATQLACRDIIEQKRPDRRIPKTLAQQIFAVVFTNLPPKPLCPACRRLMSKFAK